MTNPNRAEDSRPPKSEQASATTDIVEVAPGIARMQLPVDMPGLGHVNCYILEDEHGLALVDPGLPHDHSYAALRERLADYGAKASNVHTVVVTHSHPDHFGGYHQIANDLDREVGLITHSWFRDEASRREWRENLDFDSLEPRNMSIDELRELFQRETPWGNKFSPPDVALERFRESGSTAMSSFRLPAPTTKLDDSQVITLARREWIAVHTPGHTEDHLCLYDPIGKIMLSGDHVLPTITPHIGGITPQEDPLAAFFESLDRMHEFETELVLPAHGVMFEDLGARADDIKLHHEERLDLLRELADELGEASVNAYMRRLFRERSWGEMAESETYAHLEHLRIMGDTIASEREGMRTYAPAA